MPEHRGHHSDHLLQARLVAAAPPAKPSAARAPDLVGAVAGADTPGSRVDITLALGAATSHQSAVRRQIHGAPDSTSGPGRDSTDQTSASGPDGSLGSGGDAETVRGLLATTYRRHARGEKELFQVFDPGVLLGRAHALAQRGAAMTAKPAQSTILLTAASWVMTSRRSRPSSIIFSAPGWPGPGGAG